MHEERLRILQLVRDGRLSPTEAAALLAALGPEPRSPSQPATPPPSSRESRRLHLRVTDTAGGRTRVHLTLPLDWLDLGLRWGGLNDTQRAQVRTALLTMPGDKLLDVEDAESGERVEILVE
ncbi:MAG: hypothetical protein NZP34_15340 [Caldilineales bacterium]|nr:hypothetical protein [Caldilineales bacterium]